MSRPTAVIVDVDGTLCDVREALPLLPNLDEFHKATARCPVTLPVLAWVEDAVAAGHRPFIVTARMVTYSGHSTLLDVQIALTVHSPRQAARVIEEVERLSRTLNDDAGIYQTAPNWVSVDSSNGGRDE